MRYKLLEIERTEIGKRLGKLALEEVATLVKPDTILAWHHKFVARKSDGSKQLKTSGRPISWSRTSVCPMIRAGNAVLRVTNGSWTTQRLRS